MRGPGREAGASAFWDASLHFHRRTKRADNEAIREVAAPLQFTRGYEAAPRGVRTALT